MDFYQALAKDSSMLQALEAFEKCQGQTVLYGISGTPKCVLVAAAYNKRPKPFIVALGSDSNLEQWKNDLQALLPDEMIDVLPTVDLMTFTAAAKSVELAARRMNLLNDLAQGQSGIILCSGEALIQPVMPKEEFEKSRLVLKIGQILQRDHVLQLLVQAGYERVDQVDAKGQFSARGGIVDVYPVNKPLPIRMEWFDQEIDSLRTFDPVTQRSENMVNEVAILPVFDPVYMGRGETLFHYLTDQAVLVFDEPARLRESMSKVFKENPALKKKLIPWAELMEAGKPITKVYLSLMVQKVPHIEPDQIISLTVKNIISFQKQMDLFYNEVRNWLERNYTIRLFLSSADKARTFAETLREEGLSAQYLGHQSSELKPGLYVTEGFLSNGFELPHSHEVFLSEKDLFGRQKKKRRPRMAKEGKIAYFRDINLGDYVVHVNHGIGKYVGVETLAVGDAHKDYLLIRYAGEDKLYVPTDQVQLLQKYIGPEGEVPRLSKLGGSDWNKVKSKAKAAVADMAKELLELYAKRQMAVGFAFEEDTPWQSEFEEAFPFEETPDQLQAICEIKQDMEKAQPMDRLLCGDVGFGKTEVAIRAAFKGVVSGKQVAVLVPTTVLAQQHYQTFSSRFASFGPVVDVISRFRSAKEQKQTVKLLSEGKVDVLIGTHRLLQSDVKFKNLGLLIVDEEQRFGVAQKEKLKKWCNEIDVLTLSATPIPRTLHMSLVGARDISIIETPPEERQPVQTYVAEYEDDLVREAMKRELKRGGQIYYVYNKVQSIDKMARTLETMLPDARIGVAHGQMAEELLEKVMLDFYEGHYDILLCTSIIENGLDVANANTIIVHDADHFGLSQLYQMRGRVGRSHRLAFAYFLYQKNKVLTEIAEKRLQAIKEFAELGAGFKIAMRDLEIRGAGNLLGSQQHGHIVSVGFEMYCRLLEEAVQELKNGAPVDIPVDPVLEIQIDAYFSSDYIPEALHKMELYQKIAALRTDNELQELTDELIDRFGEPPLAAQNLLGVAKLKNMLRQIGVKAVLQKPAFFEITFTDQASLKVEQLLNLRNQWQGQFTILQGPPVTIRLKYKGSEQNKLALLLKFFAGLQGSSSSE